MTLLELGRPAPDATLLADGDREVRLSDFWRRAPTVFVFLRHFG
jgi:peroxiredoxin